MAWHTGAALFARRQAKRCGVQPLRESPEAALHNVYVNPEEKRKNFFWHSVCILLQQAAWQNKKFSSRRIINDLLCGETRRTFLSGGAAAAALIFGGRSPELKTEAKAVSVNEPPEGWSLSIHPWQLCWRGVCFYLSNYSTDLSRLPERQWRCPEDKHSYSDRTNVREVFRQLKKIKMRLIFLNPNFDPIISI